MFCYMGCILVVQGSQVEDNEWVNSDYLINVVFKLNLLCMCMLVTELFFDNINVY